MRKFLLIFIGFVITVLGYSQEFVVTDYGVKNDSSRLCTRALQNLIDSASQNGGGTIVIPQGVFLSGALFFKPHTRNIKVRNCSVENCSEILLLKIRPDTYQVSDIVFRNIDISAKTSGIKTRFTNLKFENVLVNGALFQNK